MSFPKKCKIYVVRKRKAFFTHLTDLGVGKEKILHLTSIQRKKITNTYSPEKDFSILQILLFSNRKNNLGSAHLFQISHHLSILKR